MPSEPPIYPAYCHDLSPTWKGLCPLSCRTISQLIEIPEFKGQHIYHFLNHPIKWVRLTGVVVDMDERANRAILTIDDGSGVTVEACCKAPPRPEGLPSGNLINLGTSTSATTTTAAGAQPANPNGKTQISPDGPDLSPIALGSIVRINGGIDTFRAANQVAMSRVHLVRDTAAELAFWRKREDFYAHVLSRPWVVDPEDEERCRRRADGREQRGEEARGREERRRRRREHEERRAERERRRREREVERERVRERERRRLERLQREIEDDARAEERARRVRALRQSGKYAALGV